MTDPKAARTESAASDDEYRALPTQPIEKQIEWVRKMRDDHVEGVKERGDILGDGTSMIVSILRSLERFREMHVVPAARSASALTGETPRTDVVVERITRKWQVELWEGERELANVARQFERELAEMMRAYKLIALAPADLMEANKKLHAQLAAGTSTEGSGPNETSCKEKVDNSFVSLHKLPDCMTGPSEACAGYEELQSRMISVQRQLIERNAELAQERASRSSSTPQDGFALADEIQKVRTKLLKEGNEAGFNAVGEVARLAFFARSSSTPSESEFAAMADQLQMAYGDLPKDRSPGPPTSIVKRLRELAAVSTSAHSRNEVIEECAKACDARAVRYRAMKTDKETPEFNEGAEENAYALELMARELRSAIGTTGK